MDNVAGVGPDVTLDLRGHFLDGRFGGLTIIVPNTVECRSIKDADGFPQEWKNHRISVGGRDISRREMTLSQLGVELGEEHADEFRLRVIPPIPGDDRYEAYERGRILAEAAAESLAEIQETGTGSGAGQGGGKRNRRKKTKKTKKHRKKRSYRKTRLGKRSKIRRTRKKY